jgi:hypothetical protein
MILRCQFAFALNCEIAEGTNELSLSHPTFRKKEKVL